MAEEANVQDTPVEDPKQKVDEYGIPIKSAQPKSDVDEYGIPIKKKNSASTSSTLPQGGWDTFLKNQDKEDSDIASRTQPQGKVPTPGFTPVDPHATKTAKTPTSSFQLDLSKSNPYHVQAHADEVKRQQQIEQYNKLHPGSWKNTLPTLTHSLGNAGAKIVSDVAGVTRDIIGKVDPKTDAAKPLYDEKGELTEYGKSVDQDREHDILGNLVIGFNAYNDITNKKDQENPLPHNLLGNTASGAINLIPDLALAAIVPEDEAINGASRLNKVKNAIWNPLTKVGTIQEGLNSYNVAKQKGKEPGDALTEGLTGAGKGFINYGTMGLLGGLAGDIISPKAYKTLTEAGIVKEGAITKAGLDVASDVGVFSLYPIASNLVQGKPFDLDEVESNAGMGLLFGALKGYKTIKDFKGIDDSQKEDIARMGLSDRQTIAMQNFMNATPESIAEAHTLGHSVGDLNAMAIEEAAKIKDEKDPDKKNQHAAAASTFAKASDIKGVTQAILQDKGSFIESIQNSEMPDDQKEAVIGKINQIHANLDPVEKLKKEYGEKMTELDGAIKNANDRVTAANAGDDPVEKVEAGVVADKLQQERASLDNKLAKHISEEYERQAKVAAQPLPETLINNEQKPNDQAGEKPLPEKPQADEAGKPEANGDVPTEKPKEEINTEDIKLPPVEVNDGDSIKIPLIKNNEGAVYGEGQHHTLNKLGYTDEEIDKLPQKDVDDILTKNIENPNVVTSAEVPKKEQPNNENVDKNIPAKEELSPESVKDEPTGKEAPAENDGKVIEPEKPVEEKPKVKELKKELSHIDKKLQASKTGGASEYLPYSERLKLENRKADIEKQLNPEKKVATSGAIPLPYTKEFIEHDIKPALEKIGNTFKDGLSALVRTLSPKTGVSIKAVDTITKNLNSRNEAMAALDKAVGQIEKMFDKMPDAERIDFIDRIKRGIKQPNPELQAIADAYKQLDKDLYDEISKYKGALPFKDDHFRVLWEKIPGSQPAAKDRKWFAGARRPLEGSKGFFKKATLVDMSEGIAKGGVPVSTNPMTLFKLASADAQKFITASKMFEALKNDKFVQHVKTGRQAPDGFVKINDKIANVYFPVKEGLVKAGEWYIEENAGRLVNNHLSTDHIRNNSVGAGLMHIKNLYTAAELGLSGYHASAIALEGVSSDIGRGLRKMINLGARGDFKAAGEGILDILKAPFSPKTTFSLGRSTIKLATVKDFENSPFGKQFLKDNPAAEQYIHDFFMGGGLMKQSEDLKASAFKGLKEQAGKDNYIGAALRAIPALNELVMSPLFDHYIPAMKVGMFMNEFPLALQEQGNRISSGKTTREAVARKTISFIDDRLGEMNFDNLFWDRTFKTATQLMLRSVTWKLGNLRAMGGAPIEQAQELHNAYKEGRAPLLEPKAAWVLGLAAMQVALASVTQYMFTGKPVQNFKDLIAPRTDEKDDKQRIVLPTYVKDGTHLAYKGPVDYVKSSLSGDVSKLNDIWNNEDFQKFNIYDPEGSITSKAKDMGSYLLPKPISVSNLQKSLKEGDSPAKIGMNLFGLGKAPKYLTEPSIENKIYDMYNLYSPVRSKGDKETYETKQEISKLYAKGKVDDAEKLAEQAIEKGLLKPNQISSLIKGIGKNDDAAVYFFGSDRIPNDVKVSIFNEMTDEEKEKYDPKGKVRILAEKKSEFEAKKKEKPFSILGQ